ncbi:hypothetical protein BLSTO_05998 [Blastocystis sp. subtype 1]
MSSNHNHVVDVIRRVVSRQLNIDVRFIVVIMKGDVRGRRLESAMEFDVRVTTTPEKEAEMTREVAKSSMTMASALKDEDPVVFPNPSVQVTPESKSSTINGCEDGFMEVHFSRVSGDARCQVRLSNEAMKTDGLVLVEKFTATPMAYCLNPGYYYIGCNGAAVVNVKYLTYNKDHDLTAAPHYKVLKLDQVKEQWTSVPSGHKTRDFDKSKPITGKPAYPADPTNKGSDFTCDQADEVHVP